MLRLIVSNDGQQEVPEGRFSTSAGITRTQATMTAF
jgi:hypothetical protein